MAEDNPAAQRQTAVTVYLKSKQLLLFVFAWLSVCQYSMAEENPAAQRQTAVTVYLKSKQLLLFVFLRLYCSARTCHEHGGGGGIMLCVTYFHVNMHDPGSYWLFYIRGKTRCREIKPQTAELVVFRSFTSQLQMTKKYVYLWKGDSSQIELLD